MTFAEQREWAKALTNEQLSAALEEMRDRGAAVAIYGSDDIRTMYDGLNFAVEPEDWLDDENRAYVEEAMCDAARQIFERELEPSDEDQSE